METSPFPPLFATSPAMVETRYGKPTVLARLHDLFPSSSTSYIPPPTPYSPALDKPIPQNFSKPSRTPRKPSTPKCIKIRIMTWNMHDSIPRGDLEELLGSVPLYMPPPLLSNPTFPQFSLDNAHPYHLVVVAGQECPSNLGIPMGLGAGFKLIDKEKDKLEKDTNLEHHRSGKLHPKDSESLRSSRKSPEDSPPHDIALSGWSAMVENWLCYAGNLHSRVVSPSTSDISIPKPLSSRMPAKEQQRGPYQLLVKDRLMGIYLAVYIHRDVLPFVKGTSKSSVTAGLIGGRVGNKGGVGISVNLDGTSLLFMNCHLAAHEGKIHHRLANLAKIKAELAVDAFLPPDDARMLAEDLTDKFDYSFVCGDLNFRLDIQRLHADWLISRQDYAQALTFDQLKALMDTGEAFVGFKEAPINFPPTFKYDVLRSLKGAKRSSAKLTRWKSQEQPRQLTEVEEKEHSEDENGDKDSDGEETSIASSAWTSMHSRPLTDHDPDDDIFDNTAATIPSNRLSLASAALKSKWLAAVSPVAPISPSKWFRPRTASACKETASLVRKKSRRRKASLEITTDATTEHQASEQSPSLDAIPMDRHVLPQQSQAESHASSVSVDTPVVLVSDIGRYDTSHKKRVPSWCDRILYKTTVRPEPEEPGADTPSVKPRARVAQFFANAFRPLSAKRRESSSSLASLALPSCPTPKPTPEEQDIISEPFPRFVYSASPEMTHSRSIETFPSSSEIKPVRRSNSDALTRERIRTRPRRAVTTAVEAEDESGPSLLPQLPPIPTSRWRFFPFRNSNHQSPSTNNNLGQNLEPSPELVPRRKKGDIVCLSYDTLDDGGMRRLEGRSDHRPVIGTYAVYL